MLDENERVTVRELDERGRSTLGPDQFVLTLRWASNGYQDVKLFTMPAGASTSPEVSIGALTREPNTTLWQDTSATSFHAVVLLNNAEVRRAWKELNRWEQLAREFGGTTKVERGLAFIREVLAEFAD